MSINTLSGLYCRKINIDRTVTNIAMDIYPLDFISHWKRCAITANFFSTFLPFDFTNKEKTKNLLSIIINELIENAIKFSYDKTDLVPLNININTSSMCVEINNITEKKHADQLKKLAIKLENENIDDLLLNTIKETAEIEDASGLGLISCVKNLNGRIDLKISPSNEGTDNLYSVTIKVILDKKEIDKL